MGFLSSFFKQIVGTKANQYNQAIQADIRRKTTSRVRARMINAQQEVDNKVMRTANQGLKVLDGENPMQAAPSNPHTPPSNQPQHGHPHSAPHAHARSPSYSGGERTQAIDISQLNPTGRQVVGWIVARNGNHQGQDFCLYPGKNVIGTAADCDLVVTDPYLSARHTTIRYENGNFVALDLDSKNGTYVNQKRITKEELIDNDTIRLGKTEFKFKSLD